MSLKKRAIIPSILFLLLYTGLVFYLGWNGWTWLQSAFGFETIYIYSIILGLAAYSYIIGIFVKRTPFFRLLGSYWFGFLQYALLLFPVADLTVWALRLSGVNRDSAVMWTGTVVMTMFVIILFYGTFQAYSPVVRTYRIEIPKEAGNRKNLRIAMASDMHFGHLSGLNHLRRLVRGIMDIQPDLILLPGDIVDDDPEVFIRKRMGDMMKELSAPLGVYGVLGNHEYYGGAIPKFVAEMERAGITILQDEWIHVENSFYLVGRKDKTDRNRKPIQTLVTDLDHNCPIIMMDHQPADLQAAEQSGVDLLMSGHTHRGQMTPNHLITQRIFENDWGYLQKNSLHTIVSSGFGFWGPPIRIGSRSEIVRIDVVFTAPER
ncbi:metallophosphoesterase [Mesobacillus zeae]|uniref:Metallophosphoesterase n=1 Tax=Mesobacillus zeae TaxID=1917180 RepID=A0A398AZ07_9BACI|nr:metallophosphoesterase [Mesobacillus zeae]RID82284.1 metallophosphoesterase [Mesobacillus zeae]